MKITGTDGKKYTIRSRANLRDANLEWANLSGANLSEVNLMDTNLSKANLRGANLQINSENLHMHSPTITN